MSRHFLSIAGIFRNENDYLTEWLDYHLDVGVDHLFLCDHDGSEQTKDLLAPYIARGQATITDWTDAEPRFDPLFTKSGKAAFWQRNIQHLAYTHAAIQHRSKSVWMQKLDVDEFFFLTDGSRDVATYLKRFDPAKIRGIRVPRIDFGDSGHLVKPEGGVLENYLLREHSLSNYKDMASTMWLNDNRFCHSSHHWSYRLYPRPPFLTLGADDPLRINHYYTKSRAEFHGRQNVMGSRLFDEAAYARIQARTNTVRDDGMLRYLSSRP